MMNKEFVPYDIALAMKELGFEHDGECPFIALYNKKKLEIYTVPEDNIFSIASLLGEDETCLAPLYQQAFRWIQENSFNEDGDSLVQDYLDTRWFRTLYSPVHQDITLKECIRIFKEIVNQKKDDE